MQAIILAGGLGTRLRSVIGDFPKPMAPVDGKPFLHHLLERLSAAGFDRFLLSVGYRHEAIVDYFGSGFESAAIDYAIEATPLGTGGAIRAALAQAHAAPCFVLNGDTYVDVDFAAMQKAHVDAAARLSMAVCAVDDVGRFGALDVHDGRVTGLQEKGAVGSGFINAGVYVADADLFAGSSLPARFSFETDFLAREIGHLDVRAFVARGAFLDIGIPEDYVKAAALFAAITRPAP